MKPNYEHLLKYREGGTPGLAILQAWCEQQPGEFTITEAEAGTGLAKGRIGGGLARLHGKGLLERYKVPFMQTVVHWRTGEPYSVPRAKWCYRWVGEQA